jgi:hypothetical protein
MKSKYNVFTEKQKLDLAEDYMSQIGSRLAAACGKLKAYQEMEHCQIDQDHVKMRKDTLQDAIDIVEFAMNIKSHYIEELLEDYE